MREIAKNPEQLIADRFLHSIESPSTLVRVNETLRNSVLCLVGGNLKTGLPVKFCFKAMCYQTTGSYWKEQRNWNRKSVSSLQWTGPSYIFTHFWSQAWSSISFDYPTGIHSMPTFPVTAVTQLENHCWLMPLEREKMFRRRRSILASFGGFPWFSTIFDECNGNPIEFRGIREMTDPSNRQRDYVIDPSIIVTQPTTVC